MKEIKISKKDTIKIMAASLVVGAALFIYDYVDSRYLFDGSLERNSPGEGESLENLELTFGDNKEKISVNVSEQALEEEALDELFAGAVKEIEDTYLGDNTSCDEVRKNLVLKNSYQNGVIRARWQFDDYSVISTEGKIDHMNLEEETLVGASVELSYGDIIRCHEFYIRVCPWEENSIEGRLEAIEKAVIKKDLDTAKSDNLVLPTKVGDMDISWHKKLDYRGIELAIFGVLAAVAVNLASKKDEKNRAEDLKAQKEKDYPMIVNELSILMGAGMSFRKALERITARYLEQVEADPKKKSAGYDELVLTLRTMNEGVGEIAALEKLANRANQKDYRKLSLLLVQNIKKGSKEMMFALEQEEKNAFDMRKQRAMLLGEVASTKMLIPMGGMLLVIMVILVAPAIMQLNF